MTIPKLLDVTLRDGGLGNDFAFSDSQVERIVSGLNRASVDLIELGYYRPREFSSRTGPGVCHPEFLRRAIGYGRRAEYAVMTHTNELGVREYAGLSGTGVSWVRIPLTRENQGVIRDHASAIGDLGLRLTLNIIRVTELELSTVSALARCATEAGAAAIYIADSNGALYPARLRQIIRAIRAESELPLGLHPHDNMTLAFANALTAIEERFSYFDASLGGFGKGGGNLATELMATYLNLVHGAGYDSFALGELYEETILKWMPLKHFNRFVDNVAGLMNLNIDQLKKLKSRARDSGIPLEVLLKDLAGHEAAGDSKTLEVRS